MRGKAITIILLIITSQVTQATVNLKDASLNKSWTDFDGSEVKTSHHISRSYNSRSLSTGRFGFGWCSNLDLDLTVSSSNLIEVDFCTFRQEFKMKNKTQWHSRGDVLTKLKDHYRLQLASGEHYRFDLEGRLMAVKSKDAEFKLVYSFGSLVALSDRRNQMLHILSDSTSGRIFQIKKGQFKVSYLYADANLVAVKFQDRVSNRFFYNSEHNLVRIEYPDRSTEIYRYDNSTDRLIGATRRDGCRETYQYEIKTSQNFVGSAFEVCGARERMLSQIEFFFRTTVEGDSYLERLRKVANGRSFELKFSDAGGLE